MVLDERIQIPHYAVGWGESCSAKLGVQCSIGPSLADRSRVELALLPRLSLTRLSRTQSLFEFGILFRGLSISRSFDGHKEIVLVATTKPIEQGFAPQQVYKQGK
ncbi:hypothetical protein KY290_029855 [Solanum tuberosum]|uniref:Uncharacterized protein n=1 Tax=Solanum tuberosum TaxID=4113 RepID=A0ABQ7UNY3_SOLTU|nr:hypothetical protein KY290_029855 [Solanum tuberosum]